jgi:hypothetical protein
MTKIGRPWQSTGAARRVSVPCRAHISEAEGWASPTGYAWNTGTPQLAAAILDARFVSIPGRDHLTAVSDQRFKEAALAFLAEEPFA